MQYDKPLKLPFKIKVSTTLPINNDLYKPLVSNRLILEKIESFRPYLLKLHVRLKQENLTTLMIGTLFVRESLLGWPEISYNILPEYRCQGYATEALSTFLQGWWSTDRKDKELYVHISTLDHKFLNELNNIVYHYPPGLNFVPRVQEHLIAIVQEEKTASQKVLAKVGFKVSSCC